MMEFVNEAVTKWQIERLSTMILRMRAWLKRSKDGTPDPALIKLHIGLAEEHFHDAVSALKYNKFEQAVFSCQKGFVQVGMAQLLTTYGSQIDSTLNKALLLEKKNRRLSEEQELISYLASSLAEMKMSIEYSNFLVSDRAQGFLNSAMDYYNDALKALKKSEIEDAKRKSRAGLLQLNLAGQIIGAENEMSLPGWRGLTNPSLGDPLRRVDELFEQIVECRSLLARLPQNKSDGVRKKYEKSLNDYNNAIRSLANGSDAHAQALIRTATHEIDDALTRAEELKTAIHVDDANEVAEEEQDDHKREPLADVSSLIAQVSHLVEGFSSTKSEQTLKKLQIIQQGYKDSLRALKKERFEDADKLASAALMELDLLRHTIATLKSKSAMKETKERELE